MFRVGEFDPVTVSLPSAINLADELAVSASSQTHGCNRTVLGHVRDKKRLDQHLKTNKVLNPAVHS